MNVEVNMVFVGWWFIGLFCSLIFIKYEYDNNNYTPIFWFIAYSVGLVWYFIESLKKRMKNGDRLSCSMFWPVVIMRDLFMWFIDWLDKER